MRRALIVLSLLVVMSMVPFMGASEGGPSRDLTGLTQHQPIRIDSNQAFQGVAASEGWTGDGSQVNPYVISDYLINGNGHGYGIFIGNVTSHFVIRNCQITDATGNWHFYYEDNGVYLYNSSNALIDGCWVDNGTVGIYIYESDLITVRSSTIVDLTGNAISGNYANNITVSNNTFKNTGTAIYFSYFCNNIQIRDNLIQDCSGIGIGLGSLTGNCVIERNTISGCANNGILLSHSEYNIVRYNFIRWCPVGIQVEMEEGAGFCQYNEISNNTIRENNIGIGSDKVFLNTYEYNNISYSGLRGIEIGPASHNETIRYNDLYRNDGYGLFIEGDVCFVYGNSFIMNNNSTGTYNFSWVQARNDGVGSVWAMNGRGNYWSDWIAPDNDSNGIVDIPYRFHGRQLAEDPFPLADNPRPPIRIPSPPLDLQGTTGRYFIQLSWNLPLSYPDHPVDGYYLYKNSSGSGGLEIVETLSPGVLQFTDPDLVPGMTYGYAISAFNEKGESSLSNPVILQVTELYRAPVVQITSPVEGSYHPAGDVEVTWTVDLLGAELHHFEIGLDGETWTDVGTNTSHFFIDQQSNLTTIHIRCFNDEGTFGTDTVTINIDNTAPEILIVSPAQNSLINSSTIVTNWTIIENGSGIGSVRIRIDDRNWTDVTDVSYHSFINIHDSIHTITIEATDKVGNSANISIQFTVDTIPPSVLDIGPAGFDAEMEETIYMDFGDEIDPSSVDFFIFPETPGSLNITDLRIEFTPDEPLIPGTEYFISIYYSDEAGNRVGPYQWDFRVAEYYLEGTISGYVVDSYDEYVQGAMVTVGNVTVFTDIFGKFNLDILPGDHEIFISKDGYTPYAGNVTILPTQELDLGKLVIEGGNSPIQDVDEDDIPWVPIFIVILVIGGVGVGIMSIKNKAGNEDLDVEE